MNSIFEYQSIESYLQDCLRFKQSINPRYSMRALARDFKIDIGNLSRLMNGQNKISLEQVYKIQNNLKLKEKELLFLIHLAFNKLNDSHKKIPEKFNVYELCGLGFGMSPSENLENQAWFNHSR